MATKFETETCTRCGGCGQYSYNQVDGSRCYGCGGSGVQLTNRGSKARKFLLDSQQVPVTELKVGHWIWDNMHNKKAKWNQITEIVQSNTQRINSNGSRTNLIEIRTSQSAFVVNPESKVRAVADDTTLAQQLASAIDYQNSLKK